MSKLKNPFEPQNPLERLATLYDHDNFFIRKVGALAFRLAYGSPEDIEYYGEKPLSYVQGWSPSLAKNAALTAQIWKDGIESIGRTDRR